MDWWNFSDSTFLIFFITVTISFVVIGLLVLSFALSKRKDLIIQKSITNESNTIRVYVIDFKNNLVSFFNRSSINKKGKMTLTQFYMRYQESDVDKIKNWLYAICVENRIVDDYLEIDMVSTAKHTNYYSILKNIKYDQKVGLLHLESRLMKYISPKKADSGKGKVRGGFINKADMKKIIEKQRNLSGYTYCFRFFYLRNKGMGLDHVEKVIVSTLKDVIYSFVYNNRPRHIIDEQNSEIFLFDLAINDKERAIKLVANIIHQLKKVMSIEGYSDDVGFAVGIVENAQYYQDFDAIIKTSQQSCIYSQQHNLDYYFYTRSSKLILSESGKYSQEISRLLRPNNLKYTFRPIVNAEKGSVLGYFNYISAPESPFSNYIEMSKYSAKVHRNKELFAYVSRNVVSRFTSESPDPNSVLFIPVTLFDIPFLYEVLSQNPSLGKCQLVVNFSERDFDEEEADLASIYQAFDSMTNLGVKKSLLMHDQNLLLDPAVYSHFDYFIVGSSMVKDIRKSKFSRLSIHTLVEQLLKYKKPIIASEVEGWQAIELIINSGVTYLSSETISPNSPMILPIEKRKIEKIMAISQSYR